MDSLGARHQSCLINYGGDSFSRLSRYDRVLGESPRIMLHHDNYLYILYQIMNREPPDLIRQRLSLASRLVRQGQLKSNQLSPKNRWHRDLRRVQSGQSCTISKLVEVPRPVILEQPRESDQRGCPLSSGSRDNNSSHCRHTGSSAPARRRPDRVRHTGRARPSEDGTRSPSRGTSHRPRLAADRSTRGGLAGSPRTAARRPLREASE